MVFYNAGNHRTVSLRIFQLACADYFSDKPKKSGLSASISFKTVLSKLLSINDMIMIYDSTIWILMVPMVPGYLGIHPPMDGHNQALVSTYHVHTGTGIDPCPIALSISFQFL